MLKKLLTIIPAFVIFSMVFGQVHQSEVINPEFKEYQKQLKAGRIDQNYGFMPHSVKPVFSTIYNKTAKELPETYDMREFDWVTPVKDQKRCGSCWNFTTLAAIESNWLMKGYGSFDLSEQNMRTCSRYYNTEYDGTCNAGNHFKAAAYLFSNQGPIDEVNDPYNTDRRAECTEGLERVAYIPEAIFLPTEAETGTILRSYIKQAILDYGGVFTSMYMDEDLLQGDSIYYSSISGEIVNHAVLLVGWNDTIKISNKTGAWIVKNSWSTDWGRNGYFYLSFKDKYALSDNAVFPTRVEANHYDTVYMYDEVGWISNSGFGSDVAYGLVKYTTSGKQKIVEVGTYVSVANTELEFEFYLGKKRNILFDKVAEAKGITCENPGHYKFNLDDTLHLLPNTDFYIKVKYYTPEYNYPLPTEKLLEYYSYPKLEKGKCWISSSGEFWTGLEYDDSLDVNRIDLTIKAYAIADTISSTTDSKSSVAPNPASNYLLVEVENVSTDDVIVELVNTRGNIVFRDTFQNYEDYFSYRYDVSHLDSGIYFLRITNGNFTDQKKLIIVR